MRAWFRRLFDAYRHPGEYPYQREYRRWRETLRKREGAQHG